MEPTDIPGRCGLRGEARQRDRGQDGQRDSCAPAGAGRDRHTPRHVGDSDLAAFEPADAGICMRHWDQPTLTFAWGFCRDHRLKPIARGVAVFLLGVWGFF